MYSCLHFPATTFPTPPTPTSHPQSFPALDFLGLCYESINLVDRFLLSEKTPVTLMNQI